MQAGVGVYEKRWWALAVLCLSLLIVNLDNLILNVALPTLSRELSATGSQLQWMVDAYVLVFAGLLLTAGAIGDRFGRKKTLFAGLAVFTVGSLGAALSGSAEFLIAMRVVMGIGGAFIMPSTLSILANIFPPHERPRAIAIWTATVAVGVPAGPVLGGLLLEQFAWGSVFLINLPIIVVAGLAGSALIPESSDATERPLDLVGALLSIGALGALLFAIIEAPTNGWSSPETFVLFVVAGILLSSFIIWELTRDQPLLDLALFRRATFGGAALSIALVFFALFASIFFLTQYLQIVLGYSALAAGVRMTPVAVGLIVGTILSTRLRPITGTRIVVAAGLATTAGGLAILASVSEAGGYGTVLASLLVAGFGMGLTSAPATNSIMGSVPRQQAGVASAINNITRPVGGALGVAVLGSLLSTAYRSSMEGPTAALPADTAEMARDSIGAAAQAAGRLGGPGGDALLLAAQNSFVDAMSTAILAGVGVALLGAIVAAAILPSREREFAAGDRMLSPHHGGPASEASRGRKTHDARHP